MRILFIIAQMSAGGAERQAAIICNHWAVSGHDICLATFEHLVDHYSLNARITRVGLRNRYAHSSTSIHITDHRAIRGLIDSWKPSVIISFGDISNIKTLAATLQYEIPVIVSERTIPDHLRISRPGIKGVSLAALRRLLYWRASALVVQTRAACDWAVRHRVARRIEVIPNVVANDGAVSGPHDQPIILAVGRMSREKGHDVLLEGFDRVARSFPGWHLRLVGDGPCKPHLVQRVHQVRLEDRVEFVLPLSDVFPQYQRASIFVLPSRYEGFPNVLIEAMQSGCAVIASNCPLAPREIIHDGVDGLLFKNGSSEALAKALRSLMLNPVKRQELGTAARAVSSRYSAEVILPHWDCLLTEVVKKKS